MKALLTSIIALLLSASAQAAIVKGDGASRNAPCGDSDSVQEAQIAADQDANNQCGGRAIRISAYRESCRVFAHGYVILNYANADYECR